MNHPELGARRKRPSEPITLNSEPYEYGNDDRMEVLRTEGLSKHFGGLIAVNQVNFFIHQNESVGIIGPNGSGKTTFLRALNRMNELETGFRLEGRILLDGEDIYSPQYDVVALRKKVGMVFALPVALPLSIYENLVYGPRLAGVSGRDRLDKLVEKA